MLLTAKSLSLADELLSFLFVEDGGADRPPYVRAAIDSFRALPPAQQERALVPTYLLFEQYLTQACASPRWTPRIAEALRALLGRAWQPTFAKALADVEERYARCEGFAAVVALLPPELLDAGRALVLVQRARERIVEERLVVARRAQEELM